MHEISSENGNERASSPDRLLTTIEAARHLTVSVSYLNKLRITGRGPEFIKLSEAVRYRKSALDVWANNRRYISTSAVPPKVKRDDNPGSAD